MTTKTQRRATTKAERFSVIPPLGSKSHTTFHTTVEEARSAAFNVAASSPEGLTEVLERTDAGYETVGSYDYCGRWKEASK